MGDGGGGKLRGTLDFIIIERTVCEDFWVSGDTGREREIEIERKDAPLKTSVELKECS